MSNLATGSGQSIILRSDRRLRQFGEPMVDSQGGVRKIYVNGTGHVFSSFTEPPGSTAEMHVYAYGHRHLTITFKIRGDALRISRIKNPDTGFHRPLPECTGLGLFQLVLEEAERIARALGLRRLLIEPFCETLFPYYGSFGFGASKGRTLERLI